MSKTLSDFYKGWLSGIIDSDGAICFNSCSKRGSQHFLTLRMQVDNSSRNFIEQVQWVIGEGAHWPYRLKREQGLFGKTPKPMWRYACGSNCLRWLLPQLHLIGKSRQQKIALLALPLLNRGRWRTKEENNRLCELQQAMREANSKGNTNYRLRSSA